MPGAVQSGERSKKDKDERIRGQGTRLKNIVHDYEEIMECWNNGILLTKSINAGTLLYRYASR
jgi:hypothetical protein